MPQSKNDVTIAPSLLEDTHLFSPYDMTFCTLIRRKCVYNEDKHYGVAGTIDGEFPFDLVLSNS